jgi:hypothetical protein
VDSIPMIKAVQAELTGEPVWRSVRPPLRPADAVVAARTAVLLRRLDGPQRLAAE